MSNIKFKLNKKGVKALLKSDNMKTILESYGNTVISSCGDGYEMEARYYPERNGVAIKAGNMRAIVDNSKNNTLLKALEGAKK